MPATSLLFAAALWAYWPAPAFLPVGCGGTPRVGPSPIAATPMILDLIVLQGATATGTVNPRPNGNEMDGYDASRTVPWITLTPESGSCETTGGCDPLRITVRAGTMDPGRYNGSVTLVPYYLDTCGTTTKRSLSGSAQTISVRMAIPAGPCDLNADGTTNILDLQLLANVVIGARTCSGNCDLNRDNAVNAGDLQLLADVILGARSCP